MSSILLKHYVSGPDPVPETQCFIYCLFIITFINFNVKWCTKPLTLVILKDFLYHRISDENKAKWINLEEVS